MDWIGLNVWRNGWKFRLYLPLPWKTEVARAASWSAGAIFIDEEVERKNEERRRKFVVCRSLALLPVFRISGWNVAASASSAVPRPLSSLFIVFHRSYSSKVERLAFYRVASMQEAVSILYVYLRTSYRILWRVSPINRRDARCDATYDATEIMARRFTPLLTTTNEMENIERYVLYSQNDIYPFEIEMVFFQRLFTGLYQPKILGNIYPFSGKEQRI